MCQLYQCYPFYFSDFPNNIGVNPFLFVGKIGKVQISLYYVPYNLLLCSFYYFYILVNVGAESDGKLLSWILGIPFELFTPPRSEEHTSELQSRENLVCRL